MEEVEGRDEKRMRGERRKGKREEAKERLDALPPARKEEPLRQEEREGEREVRKERREQSEGVDEEKETDRERRKASDEAVRTSKMLLPRVVLLKRI